MLRKGETLTSLQFISLWWWINPSGRITVLGSTQPLTEMSTTNIFWGLRRPVCRADKVTNLCADYLQIWGAPTWNPMGFTFYVSLWWKKTFLSYRFAVHNWLELDVCNFVWIQIIQIIQIISMSIFAVIKTSFANQQLRTSDDVNFGSYIPLNSRSQNIFSINKSIVSIKYGIFYDSLTIENEVRVFIWNVENQ
jgi:hypothetical protein